MHSSDGGTVSVGSYDYSSAYSYDGYIQKRNKNSSIAWTKKVFETGGAMAEYLYGVTGDGTGKNYVAVGQGNTSSNGYDGWVVHFSDAGAILKSFLITLGPKNDTLRDVVAYNATTFYAAGYSYSLNTMNQSYNSTWLTKLDVASGKALWNRARVGIKASGGFPTKFTFNHYGAYGIARVGSNLFTAGYTNDGGFGGNDGHIIKWNLDGGIVSQKAYGTSGNDSFYGLVNYGSSYLWAVGTVTNGNNGADGWVHKTYTSNLNQLDDKRYGGSSTDYFSGVANYGSGIVAVGRSDDTAASRSGRG